VQDAASLPKRTLMAVHNATSTDNLNALIATMKPGDTLQLADGIYRQRLFVNVPGITIQGSTAAIIDGSGITGMSVYAELVSVRYPGNNVTLQGFTVRNSPGEGIGIGDASSMEMTGCRLLNLTIHDTQYNAVTVEKHDSGLFAHLTIFNSAMMNHPSKRKGDDWPGGFVLVKGSDNNVVRNCDFSWIWGEPMGWFWNSRFNVIEDCSFVAHWGPVDFDVAGNNTVRRCQFRYVSMNDPAQQKRAIVLGNEKGRNAQNAMAAGASSDYNVVEDCFFGGYEINVGLDQQDGAPRTPDRNVVQFNTFVGGDIGRFEGGGVNNVVRNNIFYQAHIAKEYRGKAYNNLFWLPTGNVGNGAIIADPQFVNPSGTNPADWRIAATSPAVGKATEGIPPTDYFGNPRPTPASLGAHEPTVIIEPEAKGWRIPYMVEGDDAVYYLPPPPDVGQTLVSTENGEFEWAAR
jgi:hypothetical protein